MIALKSIPPVPMATLSVPDPPTTEIPAKVLNVDRSTVTVDVLSLVMPAAIAPSNSRRFWVFEAVIVRILPETEVCKSLIVEPLLEIVKVKTPAGLLTQISLKLTLIAVRVALTVQVLSCT